MQCSLSLTCAPPSPKEATSQSSIAQSSRVCQLTSITTHQLARDCGVLWCTTVYFCACVWHPLLIPSLNPLEHSMWWVLQSSDLTGLTDQGHAACVIAEGKQSSACFEQILLLVFLYDLFRHDYKAVTPVKNTKVKQNLGNPQAAKVRCYEWDLILDV